MAVSRIPGNRPTEEQSKILDEIRSEINDLHSTIKEGDIDSDLKTSLEGLIFEMQKSILDFQTGRKTDMRGVKNAAGDVAVTSTQKTLNDEEITIVRRLLKAAGWITSMLVGGAIQAQGPKVLEVITENLDRLLGS